MVLARGKSGDGTEAVCVIKTAGEQCEVQDAVMLTKKAES